MGGSVCGCVYFGWGDHREDAHKDKRYRNDRDFDALCTNGRRLPWWGRSGCCGVRPICLFANKRVHEADFQCNHRFVHVARSTPSPTVYVMIYCQMCLGVCMCASMDETHQIATTKKGEIFTGMKRKISFGSQDFSIEDALLGDSGACSPHRQGEFVGFGRAVFDDYHLTGVCRLQNRKQRES